MCIRDSSGSTPIESIRPPARVRACSSLKNSAASGLLSPRWPATPLTVNRRVSPLTAISTTEPGAAPARSASPESSTTSPPATGEAPAARV